MVPGAEREIMGISKKFVLAGLLATTSLFAACGSDDAASEPTAAPAASSPAASVAPDESAMPGVTAHAARGDVAPDGRPSTSSSTWAKDGAATSR
jgi:hypothetical protein